MRLVLYLVNPLRRRIIRIISNNALKIILGGNAQHVRLRTVNAVSQKACFPRMQKQRCVRIRLNRTGEDDPSVFQQHFVCCEEYVHQDIQIP